jgi:hypothetical protein
MRLSVVLEEMQPMRWNVGIVALLVSGLVSTGGWAAWPPSPPSQLIMTVAETAGVARTGEIVWSGVPLPRSAGVLSTADLAVLNASGAAVPAQFEILARWHAPLTDTGAPIQWVLVAFPVTVGASQDADFRLVTDGSVANPPPAQPLVVTQNGNRVTVDTGSATFVVGGSVDSLFDEIRLADDTLVAAEGRMTAVVNGTPTDHMNLRSVRLERSGPLAASVVVEGNYDLAPVGGGGVGSQRRYEFRAGSSTAIVRHAVQWEGDRCGMDVLSCGGEPNAVLVTSVRNPLSLAMGFPRTVTAVGDAAAPAVTGNAAGGTTASVRQRLRAARLDPLLAEVSVPGTAGAMAEKADGALLAVSDGVATVAVALDHMHRYEPQALRLLANGQLSVDVVDDTAWLGNRQGLFARLAVGASAGAADRQQLDSTVWAPLNHPLRAWPSARWWAASEAVGEVPYVDDLPADLAGYDLLVPAVLDDTLAKIDDRGLAGLMTFGLYPRIWGHPWYTDELDCADPTPGTSWDTAYWCGSWTDYHNTVAAAPMWAMRSGATRYLDELAVPGAMRSLHTQMIRCDPSTAFFYCGQAPTGYGGYRADNNASHAYFDNLMLHYWLTGDTTVVEALRRGAENMRRFLCTSRGPWPVAGGGGPAGPACGPTDPLPDPWANLTGRVAFQWLSVFRFLGLASDDATFLEDYTSNLARAASQYYVEAQQGGEDYGFFFPSGGGSVVGVGTSGTRWSSQLWMASLYDAEIFRRYLVDTEDSALGVPALTPGRVESSWARTLLDFGPNLGGVGTAAGAWPNQVQVSWSGGRIGGTLSGVTADVDPDGNGVPCDASLDECLYDTGKATLAAVLVRAGQATGNPAMTQLGRDHAVLAIANAGAPLSPMGKFQGEFLARLHAAVARLSSNTAIVFSDDFETGDTSSWTR